MFHWQLDGIAFGVGRIYAQTLNVLRHECRCGRGWYWNEVQRIAVVARFRDVFLSGFSSIADQFEGRTDVGGSVGAVMVRWLSGVRVVIDRLTDGIRREHRGRRKARWVHATVDAE